jgi:crotonobetainyl-CoA:carnitine CoA-transferase CaiB-like acyl-CoA transferase
LKQAIEEVFQQFTVQALVERLQARNVPCGRVRSIGEAIDHPQVAAREIVLAQEHPQMGRIEALAPVVRLSRTPAAVRLPPPALGEHTAEVLADLKSRV